MPAHGMKSSKIAEFTWEGRENDLEGLGKQPGRIQLLAQLLVWWNLRTSPKCAFIFVGAWCEPILPASLTHGKPVCVCPCVQTGCALRVPSALGKPSVCVKHFTKERGNFVLSCGWGREVGVSPSARALRAVIPLPTSPRYCHWGGNPPFTRCPLLLTWRLPVQLPALWIQYCFCAVLF